MLLELSTVVVSVASRVMRSSVVRSLATGYLHRPFRQLVVALMIATLGCQDRSDLAQPSYD